MSLCVCQCILVVRYSATTKLPGQIQNFSMMVIGKVKKIPSKNPKEFDIEWKIKKFSSLSENKCYVSPSFSFAGSFWFLHIYPYCLSELYCADGCSDRLIGLFLVRLPLSSPISLRCWLGLKTSDGKINPEEYVTFGERGEWYGMYRFISRYELLQRKSEFVPSDILTVVCKIKHPKSDNTATEKCSYCKTNMDTGEDLLFHQQKYVDKPVKCADDIALKNWYDHRCQTGTEVTEKILLDLKKIMLSGDHSDIVIKVKKEEFQLHRSILAARNPYFDSMLKNNMKEKVTGIVTIDDCEPDTFRSFIHFVYTGKVDEFSLENVCGLYEAADKYQEDQLKNECLHFMMNTLSVDSFCDYFALALKHNEKELFQQALELFKTKVKEIARSVKWQIFVKEYPTQANELFIKVLDHYIK